jgi:CheY-like chemotaxis protein
MSADILMVEDNPDDAELALRVLKRGGNGAGSVQLVTDGAEALEYIYGTLRYAGRTVEIQPRTIFLDVKLPLVNGLEVLKRIKSDERTRRTPVVMLTSSNAETDRLRAYDLGANSYIVKPVDFGEFTSAMLACAAYWLRLNEPPGA